MRNEKHENPPRSPPSNPSPFARPAHPLFYAQLTSYLVTHAGDFMGPRIKREVMVLLSQVLKQQNLPVNAVPGSYDLRKECALAALRCVKTIWVHCGDHTANLVKAASALCVGFLGNPDDDLADAAMDVVGLLCGTDFEACFDGGLGACMRGQGGSEADRRLRERARKALDLYMQ